MITTLPLVPRPPPLEQSIRQRRFMSTNRFSNALGHRDGRSRWPPSFDASINQLEDTVRHRQNAVLEALQRALQFLQGYAALLVGIVDLTAARRRLEEVVTSFTTHALDQDVGERGARGETAKQNQLRRKLRRDRLEPIALIARRNLRSVPEFAALQMPKPYVRGQAFIASAYAMADAAAIHENTLLEHGLPSNFLDDLKTAIATLEISLSDRERNRTRRVGATKGLDVEEKNGRTVLGVLDALMQQAAADNEPLLRAWEAARLIRQRPGPVSSSSGEAPAAQEPNASTPTLLLVSDSTPGAAA